MKRASFSSHRQYNNSIHEEFKAKLKHQNLVQEFFQLQKEFASKKKKLQIMNQNRNILLAEVRFLGHRHSYLSMIKAQEYELHEGSVVQPKKPYLQSKMAKNYDINEAVEGESSCFPDLDLNVVHEGGNGRNKMDVEAPLRKEKKKPKNGLVNSKSVGKRKISWQDQVALKV